MNFQRGDSTVRSLVNGASTTKPCDAPYKQGELLLEIRKKVAAISSSGERGSSDGNATIHRRKPAAGYLYSKYER